MGSNEVTNCENCSDTYNHDEEGYDGYCDNCFKCNCGNFFDIRESKSFLSCNGCLPWSSSEQTPKNKNNYNYFNQGKESFLKNALLSWRNDYVHNYNYGLKTSVVFEKIEIEDFESETQHKLAKLKSQTGKNLQLAKTLKREKLQVLSLKKSNESEREQIREALEEFRTVAKIDFSVQDDLHYFINHLSNLEEKKADLIESRETLLRINDLEIAEALGDKESISFKIKKLEKKLAEEKKRYEEMVSVISEVNIKN